MPRRQHDLELEQRLSILEQDPTLASARVRTVIPKCNFTATAAPTVTDDLSKSYTVGSRWINISTDKEYVCLDATVGAAVWSLYASGYVGVGGVVHYDYVVDAGYIGTAGASLTLGTGAVVKMYATIQAAVTAADADNADTSILINDGTYVENVTIATTFGHKLWLVGESAGNVSIAPSTGSAISVPSTSSHDNLWFKNLNLGGASGSYSFVGTAANIPAHFEDCYFARKVGGGFSAATFRRCEFAEGYAVDNSGFEPSAVTFSECFFAGTCDWSEGIVSEHTFDNCVFAAGILSVNEVHKIIFGGCQISTSMFFKHDYSGEVHTIVDGLAFVGCAFSVPGANGTIYIKDCALSQGLGVVIVGNSFEREIESTNPYVKCAEDYISGWVIANNSFGQSTDGYVEDVGGVSITGIFIDAVFGPNSPPDFGVAANTGSAGCTYYGTGAISGTAPLTVTVSLPQRGTAAPTHTAPEGTPFWDTTNNKLYINSDGATTWVQVAQTTDIVLADHEHTAVGDGGATIQPEVFKLAVPTTLTIVDGEITVTQDYHIVSGEDGLDDELDTINGGVDGQVLVLEWDELTEIKVNSNTGNIVLDSGQDAIRLGTDVLQIRFVFSASYGGGLWIGRSAIPPIVGSISPTGLSGLDASDYQQPNLIAEGTAKVKWNISRVEIPALLSLQPEALTIADGEVVIGVDDEQAQRSLLAIDTEDGDPTDDLVGIGVFSDATDGDLILVYAANDTHTVVIKHADAGATAGRKVFTSDGNDITLDNTYKIVLMECDTALDGANGGWRASLLGASTGGAHKDSHDPEDGGDPLDTAAASEISAVVAAGAGTSHSLARADHIHAINHAITDNHLVTVDGDPADNEFARFTANGLEGLTGAETNAALPAATDALQGLVELATAAETTTGTDAGRVVTPDGLAGSDYGKRVMYIKEVVAPTTALTTGDAKTTVVIPVELNGWNLVQAEARVYTVGTGTTLVAIQIRNVTDGHDMLSTKITIDASELTSYTAATRSVVDTNEDDVVTADIIAVDIDAINNTVVALGLDVILTFILP